MIWVQSFPLPPVNCREILRYAGVQEETPELTALMEEALKMASRIAGNAPIAVRACKKAVNDGLQVDMDQALVVEEKLLLKELQEQCTV